MTSPRSTQGARLGDGSGTPSATLQGAGSPPAGACPNGHRTLWPRRCPHCAVEQRRSEEKSATYRARLDRNNLRIQAARQAARGWMEGLA